MPESYFEEANITIDANLSTKKFIRTKPYSGPVKVCFYKGAEAQPSFTTVVTATDGKFDKPFVRQAAPVAKTEEFYDLRVTCEYKDVKKLLLTATIWPKQTQVTFKDPGRQALKNFPFLLKQVGEPDQKLATGADGKCTATLMARKPYSVAPDGKFRVVDVKQATAGQFRDHVLTVETVITAKFKAPDVTQPFYEDDPDAAPAKKQWVNLKTKAPEHDIDAGCEAKGHSVVFTVTADPPDAGQPGDKVYFEVTFGSKNSDRNDPQPDLASGWPVLGKKVHGKKKITGYVVLAPMSEDCAAYFEVELGIAGGDVCEVKIGGTAEVADAKLKLINWRKMYAQVTKTAAQNPPSLADAKSCLKKVFVDLEESTAETVVLADTDVPAGAFVQGSMIKSGLPAKTLIVGIHNVAGFKTKLNPRFASEALPCAHLIYCDEQLDAKDAADMSGTVLSGQSQGKVDYPGGGRVPGLVLNGSAISKSARFFAKDLKDGSDAVKSCTWHEVGGTGSGDIDPADYLIDQVAHKDKLFIRLPDAAKRLSDSGKDIEVKCKVSYALGWYLGWCTSGDRHIVVKLGPPANEICSTIVHEIGHAVHQTAQNAAMFPGLPAPPHGRFYTNNRGHQGGHCAEGIDDAWYDDASKAMNTGYAGTKCHCIMFGAGSSLVAATMALCAKCEPYVKAAPVQKVST